MKEKEINDNNSQKNVSSDKNYNNDLNNESFSNKEPIKKTLTKKKTLKEEAQLIKKQNCKLCCMIFSLFSFIIFIYVIKPLSLYFNLLFLFKIANIIPESTETGHTEYLEGFTYYYIGYIALFGVSLAHFFTTAYKIIIIQDNPVKKLYVFFLLLIEILVDIPLTFLYQENIYSIFLFDEVGVEQLIAPWLIFYPTKHIKSIVGIIKNVIESIFFFVVGFLKFKDLTISQFNQIYITQSLVVITLSFIKFAVYLIIICIRVADSVGEDDKNNKDNKLNKENTNNKINDDKFNSNKIELNDKELNISKQLDKSEVNNDNSHILLKKELSILNEDEIKKQKSD